MHEEPLTNNKEMLLIVNLYGLVYTWQIPQVGAVCGGIHSLLSPTFSSFWKCFNELWFEKFLGPPTKRWETAISGKQIKVPKL